MQAGAQVGGDYFTTDTGGGKMAALFVQYYMLSLVYNLPKGKKLII
jgi:hypothetical protein